MDAYYEERGNEWNHIRELVELPANLPFGVDSALNGFNYVRQIKLALRSSSRVMAGSSEKMVGFVRNTDEQYEDYGHQP